MENAKEMTAEELNELFGFTPKEKEEIKANAQSFSPSLQVPLAPQKIIITFKSNEIKVIDVEEEREVDQVTDGILKKVKAKVKLQKPVTTVFDSTGVPYTLWLTSKSIKREYLKLRYRYPDLTGVKIAIWVENYIHKTFGETRAYRLQPVQDLPENKDIAAKLGLQ